MNENNNQENEISILDIIEFFHESWKTIAGFTVLGIAGAALYLSVVPKQFEATAQIKVAQIANVNSSNNNINPPGHQYRRTPGAHRPYGPPNLLPQGDHCAL